MKEWIRGFLFVEDQHRRREEGERYYFQTIIIECIPERRDILVC